jgi:hypothetical protein
LTESACKAAPVPRPPQPIKATLMVSSTEELANVSMGKEAIEMPPTAAAEAFTKSRREKFEFIICLIIELNN